MVRVRGRRELQKRERREWLLECARILLEQSEFSMRRLSEQARVADATPYNLFGSKRGVFEALYADQSVRAVARLAASGNHDPLLKLFDAIDFLAENLATTPQFHRALYDGLFERVAGRAAFGERDPGVRYWQDLIAAAASRLQPGARHDLLSRDFVYLLGGAMLDWIEWRIDVEGWRAITTHGLALLTIPLAQDDALPALRAYLADAEASLTPRPEAKLG